MNQVVPSSSKYGLTPDQLLALGEAGLVLAAAASEQARLEGALRAATEAKQARRAEMIQLLGQTARYLESRDQVSDGMLKAILLAPRPTKGVKPTSLAAPANLTATGTQEGALVLKWARTNATRTGFVVEISNDGLEWSYLTTTMKTSLSASGFPLAVPVWARVFAVNSTLSSPASNVASLYAPAAPALRVAA